MLHPPRGHASGHLAPRDVSDITLATLRTTVSHARNSNSLKLHSTPTRLMAVAKGPNVLPTNQSRIKTEFPSPSQFQKMEDNMDYLMDKNVALSESGTREATWRDWMPKQIPKGQRKNIPQQTPETVTERTKLPTRNTSSMPRPNIKKNKISRKIRNEMQKSGNSKTWTKRTYLKSEEESQWSK